ncbi:hypothetical protein HWV62_34791 [Athelia sp. TMB]|nr:hypothetical protein HWV62_34791 [Athelia sp. TMB]
MSTGPKTAPLPPTTFNQSKRNSSLTFSNPFSPSSRSSTPPIPTSCDDVFSSGASVASSSRPFLRRFATDSGTRALDSKPRRTEPYGAPYFAQPPIVPSSRSRSRSRTRPTMNRVSQPHEAEYISADLMNALDEKLSLLQRDQDQRRSRTPSPERSDSDGGIEIPCSPTPVRRRTAWGAVKRRVTGEKQVLAITVR